VALSLGLMYKVSMHPCKNLSPSSKFFNPCWVCWADSAEAFFFEQLIELLYSGSIVQSLYYPFEHRLKLGTQTFDLYKFSFGLFHSQLLALLWTIAKVCSCLPLVLERGIQVLAQNLFMFSCFILGLRIFGVFLDHHFCDLSGIHLRNKTLKRAKWCHKWTNWNEVCLYCFRCLHTWC
jgi:hypothetical protein